MTETITVKQMKQFRRIVEDACEEELLRAELSKDDLQRLLERGFAFQKVITPYIAKGIKTYSFGYAHARAILGKDIITPEEIQRDRGIIYSIEAREHLASEFPTKDEIEWCRDNRMILVAGPPTPLSLLDIRAFSPDYFYSKEPGKDGVRGAWYDVASEKFSRNDRVEPLSWIALKKEPAEGSFNKCWINQKALVKEPMIVPNAAEVAWALTTYKAVHKTYLFDKFFARTSSLSGFDHVNLGGFSARGLDVYHDTDYYKHISLGIAEARKF